MCQVLSAVTVVFLLGYPLVGHASDFTNEMSCFSQLEKAYRGSFYQLPENKVILPTKSDHAGAFIAYTSEGAVECSLPSHPAETRARIKYYMLNVNLGDSKPMMVYYPQHSADPSDITVSPLVGDMPASASQTFTTALCNSMPEGRARNTINSKLKKMISAAARTFKKDRSFTRALKGKDSVEEDYLSAMSACSQVRELNSVTRDQLRNLPISNKEGRISRLPTFAH